MSATTDSRPSFRPALPLAWLLSLVLVCLAAPAALAQEAEPPESPPGSTTGSAEPSAGGEPADDSADAEPPTPAEELDLFVDVVEVNVVNVEVYVTDKKGNRITGLEREDFEISEDRRPVELTNFYAVEDGRPVEEFSSLRVRSEAPEPIEEEGGPPPPAAKPEIPDEQRLSLIVYIDNFNIRPFNRNRVLRELRVFLGEQVQVGDRVMLVSYDRSLNVRRPFTTDPQAVATALVEIEEETGHAMSEDQERRRVIERIEDARSGSEALLWARGWAEEQENNLRFTIDALKEMVNWLSGLGGRKAVVYVSDGIPMVPGQAMFHAVDGVFGSQSGAITESLGYDASRRFQELAAQANANRVTFYTIDAAGLRVGDSIDVESRRPQPISVGSIRTHNVQSPLRYVAEATGGVAIINRNRVLPALEQVSTDFNTYYSLGYRSPEAGRGRYHKIEVKVKGRKDLRVRHREGYRDKTVEARMSDGTMTALRFELGRNPMNARIEFGSPLPKERRLWTVPVRLLVPIREIALVPRADSYEGRLRLYVAAKDAEGDASPVQQVPVTVSIPSAEIDRAREQDYTYQVDLLMRGGPHLVAVGVRDELAATESFASGRITVGRAPEAPEFEGLGDRR